METTTDQIKTQELIWYACSINMYYVKFYQISILKIKYYDV